VNKMESFSFSILPSNMLNSSTAIVADVVKIDTVRKALSWVIIVITIWIVSLLWSLSSSPFMVNDVDEKQISSSSSRNEKTNIIYNYDNVIVIDDRDSEEKIDSEKNDDDDTTADTCTDLSLDDDDSSTSLSSPSLSCGSLLSHNVSFATPIVSMIHERPYTTPGAERDSMFYNSADYKRFKKNFRRFRKKQSVTFSPWLITSPVTQAQKQKKEQEQQQQQRFFSLLYSSLWKLLPLSSEQQQQQHDNNDDTQQESVDEMEEQTIANDDLFYSGEELESFLNDFIILKAKITEGFCNNSNLFCLQISKVKKDTLNISLELGLMKKFSLLLFPNWGMKTLETVGYRQFSLLLLQVTDLNVEKLKKSNPVIR